MNNMNTVQPAMRILGVFAHPDDESFCAGGTFASFVADGAEVMVVSATRGEAGQIRSAGILSGGQVAATRRTLGRVREEDLYLACQRLGVQHAICLDYGDGKLRELDQEVLIGKVVEFIRTFRPDVVITFGPDGGYGHPDHIAICSATTEACKRSGECFQFPEQLANGMSLHTPARLFHSHFPHQQQLLLEKLTHWLIQHKTRFRGTPEFVYAFLLLCEETTLLHHSLDHFDVNWFPAGFSIVEQGEPAHNLYLILSGKAEVIREHIDGTQEVLERLEVGSFFGEEGLVYKQPQNAHVVASENMTCLIISPGAPTVFQGRGEDANLVGFTEVGKQDHGEEPFMKVTQCIDIDSFIQHKIEAIAAHHTQFPIEPDMLPLSIFQELMGREYFVSVPLVYDVDPALFALNAA